MSMQGLWRLPSMFSDPRIMVVNVSDMGQARGGVCAG
jgi:hypothetical protein